MNVMLHNPGLIPVLAFDQTLFVVAKQIQWNWSETEEERKLAIIIGGLHVEMAALKTIGKWLEDR